MCIRDSLRHLQTRIQGAAFECISSVSLTSGETDNSGNVYVLAKHYTNRGPGAAILMEVAAIMLETEAHMSISHVPRERNIWADDLANLNIAGFDPAKRWDPIAELGNTIVLKDLLLYGRQLGLHLSKKEREQRGTKARLAPASLSKPFHGRPEQGIKRRKI